MEDRRVRRFGRGQQRQQLTHHSLLPVRTQIPSRRLSNSISCWYCDCKFEAFSEPLFRFGRRHARFLRVWFSIGVGFSLAALLGATTILVWNLGTALRLLPGRAELVNLSSSILFGFSPGLYGLRLSIADISHLLLSTLVSVAVHEFGHAIAAASEGIQTEYVGVYIALLFPGALVAFNYELLQALEHFAALRVYTAGIWHNAVCCAVCGMVLFFLPIVLCPFYIHVQSPMVFDVTSTSPLSGYLSPGDVIVSLDGKPIHNKQEWMETTYLIDELTLQNSNHSKYSEGFATLHGEKGYCVSTSMMEESKKIYLVDSRSACPDDLSEFVDSHCSDSVKLDGISNKDDHSNRTKTKYCLNAKDVVKLNKCGGDWVRESRNESSCLCSQDESCLSPVQLPGLIWIEIAYSRPYSPECLEFGKKSIPASEFANTMEHNCGGTFVFVGDPIPMAHSVSLTSYQSHWPIPFAAYLPNTLEKSLMCTFHISLALALLNSLPVYFLDGESILGAALCHFTLLGPRKRAKVLRACLIGGTLTSILAFTRMFFINFL